MPTPSYYLLALAAALGVVTGPVLAQDNSVVGPAELRDFSIGGRAPNNPAPPEPPADEIPAVDAPAETATPAPSRPSTTAPAAEASSRPLGQSRQDRAHVEQEGNEGPVSSATNAPEEKAAAPVTVPSPVSSRPEEVPEPAPLRPSPTSDLSWLYIIAALILAGSGLLLLLRRRSRRPVDEEAEYLEEGAPLFAEPVEAMPKPRPWLQLEFKPGKAAATEAEASVDYELRIANVGEAEARRVRVEARLFNAQQDEEIGAFFSAPDSASATMAPRAIQPQGAALFKSVVALPKEQMREVVIQGRRLFIPMVAFNVLYEWGEGETGQTSISYLVGRESEPPAEKMAPFRLDLGPRVYRSVGFRPSNLELTV